MEPIGDDEGEGNERVDIEVHALRDDRRRWGEAWVESNSAQGSRLQQILQRGVKRERKDYLRGGGSSECKSQVAMSVPSSMSDRRAPLSEVGET